MTEIRFIEEQIITVRREHEGGMRIADVCRKHGIGNATLHAWMAKYGGVDASQVRKLKVLDDENGRVWADPDISHAAWRMRHLVKRHGADRPLIEAARRHIHAE